MFVKGLFPTKFYNADGGQIGGTNAGQTPENTGDNHNNAHEQEKDASQKQQEPMIPKSRFDEVNNKMKELQEQLEKFQKQKEQEELEVKKKKGEFENLYNETHKELENTKVQYKQTSERVGQLEALIQTLVDAELEAVPEDMRDLVPENFTPEQKLSWITQAKKKGLFGTKQNNKEEQELGGATNQQQQQVSKDIGKLSITELFKQAYGSK